MPGFSWKDVVALLSGAGTGLLALKVGLLAIGFGGGGIIYGSAAAAMQAGIGNVAAGSAFAFWQSAGAGGDAAACPYVLAGVIGALLLWGAYRAYKNGWFGRIGRAIRTGWNQFWNGGNGGHGGGKVMY